MPPELRELAAAFARGAGLGTEVAPLTPEWMEHLGALLRATAEGTLALLQSRAVTKRHMRAEGTHIAPRQNNPLKFSPDATEALTRMLQRDASPGFLDPVAALQDAHHDLLVHQVAMVAGMRAAVFELFSRLGPEAAESAEGPAHGISRLPLLRAAALWHRHRMQHAQLLEHLDDDFETIFGREFLRAYEAQSRVDAEIGPDPDADPTSPEEPWPSRALTVSLAALSQTGRRECNEDAFGYWEGAGSLVAVLCDGAGGHGGGQTASRAAVTHVLEAFALHPEVSLQRAAVAGPGGQDGQSSRSRLPAP